MPRTRATAVIRLRSERYLASLLRRSFAVTSFLERRIRTIAVVWVATALSFAFTRIEFPAGTISSWNDAVPALVAYAAIIAAPIAGYVIARDAFKNPQALNQPVLRLAVLGHWQPLSMDEARRQPEFGTAGFMTSLLVGMLLNVAMRALEFFVAVPAMGPGAPGWAHSMFAVMALDVAVMGFFYMAAFAMALRTVPLFPRMLLYAWVIDVAMQLVIARQLGMAGGMPATVAMPLLALLKGNITKVFISAVVWLPYLLLSQRVNVTYRSRTASAITLS